LTKLLMKFGVNKHWWVSCK